METNLAALLHRLRLANFDTNKNQKYRVYARGGDFFEKIGNKGDEMLRVAYHLTSFLISMPPKLRVTAKTVSAGEDLTDYDDYVMTGDEQSVKWGYHTEDFTLFGLEDLPISQEAEFDANLLMFHAFLSFIKPTDFFVNKFEMYHPEQHENGKQNVTRVLMNLTQLLLFPRSITEDSDTNDILSVIFCLFNKFPQYFSLTETEDTSLSSANVFDLFPNELSYFLLFLLAYDDYSGTSFEQFKEELPSMLTPPFALNGQSDSFLKAMELQKSTVNLLLSESNNMAEFSLKLRKLIDKSLLRQRLLDLGKFLANKILMVLKQHSELDLEVGYLDFSYEKSLNNLKDTHAKEISELRLKIEKEVNDRENEHISKLLEQINIGSQENERLTNENSLQNQELQILRSENARLKSELETQTENAQAQHVLTYQDLETNYPTLLGQIKNEMFRLSIKKAYTRISILEEQLAKANKQSTQPQQSNNNNNNMYSQLDGNGGATESSTHAHNGVVAMARVPDHVEEPQDHHSQHYNSDRQWPPDNDYYSYEHRTSYGDQSTYGGRSTHRPRYAPPRRY